MTAQRYEIQVKGQLNRHWADWLEGMQMRYLENGEMILSGDLYDQAALMGVLNKLNGLNLTILSVSVTNRNDGQRPIVDLPKDQIELLEQKEKI